MSRKKKVLGWVLVTVLIAAVCLGSWLLYKYLYEDWRPFGLPQKEEKVSEAPVVDPAESEPEETKVTEEPQKQKSADPVDEAKKAAEEDAEAARWRQDTFEAESTETEVPDLDELLADEEIPEEIRDFVSKYPEAVEYAANYKQYAEQHISVSISADVTEDGLPMYIQWDPRWGYESYGGGFLGVRGCGPTCLSMVYSGLSGHTEWNPYRMSQWAEENGYYLQDVGTEWGIMSEGAEKLGLSVTMLGGSALEIEAALSEGEPVICAVAPGDFTTSGHFIVLCGMDEEGNITVHDPNSRINSERTWTAEEIVSQLKAAWAYRVEGAPEAEAAEEGAESAEEETPAETVAPEETERTGS